MGALISVSQIQIDAHVFPVFLTPVLTQILSKPPTTFLTCISRGGKRKYVEKKFRINWVSNTQPPGHESYTLITVPPGPGTGVKTMVTFYLIFDFLIPFPNEKIRLF